jgi:hypothetical protein
MPSEDSSDIGNWNIPSSTTRSYVAKSEEDAEGRFVCKETLDLDSALSGAPSGLDRRVRLLLRTRFDSIGSEPIPMPLGIHRHVVSLSFSLPLTRNF